MKSLHKKLTSTATALLLAVSTFASPIHAININRDALNTDYSGNKFIRDFTKTGSEETESATPDKTPVPKEEAVSMIMQFVLNQKSYTVNGAPTTMDAAPVTRNERTLLPVVYVAGPLGAEIKWDAPTQKVTISLNGTLLELWIGNPTAKINGMSRAIDPGNSSVKPITMNGRTMLPLRFVAESLGCEVKWNAATQGITVTSITSSGTSSTTSPEPSSGKEKSELEKLKEEKEKLEQEQKKKEEEQAQKEKEELEKAKKDAERKAKRSEQQQKDAVKQKKYMVQINHGFDQEEATLNGREIQLPQVNKGTEGKPYYFGIRWGKVSEHKGSLTDLFILKPSDAAHKAAKEGNFLHNGSKHPYVLVRRAKQPGHVYVAEECNLNYEAGGDALYMYACFDSDEKKAPIYEISIEEIEGATEEEAAKKAEEWAYEHNFETVNFLGTDTPANLNYGNKGAKLFMMMKKNFNAN